jgi:CHAT domain-containing protein
MSLPDALKAHPQVLECAERNHRNQQGGFSGYDFNDDKDGVWFEGTAQMAVAYELAGKTAPTSFILPRPADFVSDGKWVPAVFTQEQINSSDQVVAPEPQEERWARLNGARREAELLKSLFPEARIQIAKKLDFKQVAEAARQYRYVHFATHVTSADAYKLSLAGKTEKNLAETRRDGILSLEEIFKLDLSADLVVLSACETGLGYQPRGDRLEGVISGFINAGAKRVLPSLWPVPQEAVNELLGSFYRSLRKGQSPAAALRAAQLNMWRSRQWTPSDWASFQLYGDW